MFHRRRQSRLPANQWCVAIVGMNAVGKSRFGKRLAKELGLACVDTDRLFLNRYGPIAQYIEQNGTDAFRALESQLIGEVLTEGHVVVLSGGAVESVDVRRLLRKNAAVLWIKAGKQRVLRNIAAAKRGRHEFANKPADAVAKNLLAVRTPLYDEVATITIHENIPYKRYIPIAISELSKYYRLRK